MTLNCFICGEKGVPNNHFWRTHKVNLQDYFITQFDKRDKLTGEAIPFKNPEQYVSQDFLSRVNLKRWLMSQPLDEQRIYCRNSLLRRKIDKKLTFAPTHFELKTLTQFPGVVYLNKVFGDYHSECQKLGFAPLLRDITEAELSKLGDPLVDKPILVDTREQKILKLNNIQVGKLDYGDYSLEDRSLCHNIVIERKSLPDLIGTLSNGYDRFEREIIRAKEDNGYIIVLIEAPLSKLIGFDSLKYIFAKVTPDYVLHNLRALLHKYDNLQFVCAENRQEATALLRKLLLSGVNFRELDVQRLVDECAL